MFNLILPLQRFGDNLRNNPIVKYFGTIFVHTHTHLIKYELGGGINHVSNPISYTVASAAITLQEPTRSGYTFAGWEEGEGTIPSGSTEPKTFTAQWSPSVYTVSYTLNGGTNHDGNPASYTVESPAITLQAPTRQGYDFAGWAEEEGKIPAGSTGNKTFTARWLILAGHYSIAYVLGGGENHPDNPGTYTSGDDVITLKNPNRPGYTFEGWLPENTIPAGSTGDKTFAAQWAIIDGH
ncbi:MAG: InlB B-repeat-containing protein [Prevotellaceae bacterium]|nr:InlB B-repeat-containing protein [Prevotellaceae bacterium]